METLRRSIPDAQFTLLSLSAQQDIALSANDDLNVVPQLESFSSKAQLLFGALLSRFKIDPSFLFGSQVVQAIQEYKNADAVIDIWGIIFADQMGGGFLRRLGEGYHLLVGKLFGKPVIKYTADTGPFNSRWNRFFAKFFFSRIDLIFARSEISRNHLVELGIKTPIYVFPDTAFLLPISTTVKAHDLMPASALNRPIIGISVSHTVEGKEPEVNLYSTIMAQICDYLVEKHGAYILLIPNNVFRTTYDDLDVAKKILERVLEKRNVLVISESYPAQELKGIISQCEIMIGARYHSIVASLSLGIPTIAIAWHHKYPEILKLVGQENCMCNVENLSFTHLKEKIDKLWNDRNEIHMEITTRLPSVNDSILYGGEKVKELLNGQKNLS
ncbi:polysaccharide pyruvyl transferase family protein [Methanoculleus sp.]|uniref:polysaccharide pyruvyl transferase family protein n=1 Tax=Methanoculleus sp. TaxID=90427 RepID=UPI001BD3A19B|nr:polysaccharide pyruvyl transferase family protein [Methanoculleus sp.]